MSALQTGSFAGPVGSPVGQHRFREGLVVREAQPRIATYTPRYGRFEMRARAIADPACLVALWMIGFEETPEQSAEICVFEIFGRDVGPAEARVGMGVHPFGDHRIRDDFTAERLAIDALEPHTYAAEWTPDGVAFSVDGSVAKVVAQSPAYPMQLMLTLYEFADGPAPPSTPGAYPRTFVVESFRGYRPVSGPGARPPAFEAGPR